jgi:hypothetical protein
MPVAVKLPAPLREGDTCTSAEFVHRWEAMPDLKHAELIDGVVFTTSAISYAHGKASGAMGLWLALYRDDTYGVERFAGATVTMGPKDVSQPDLALRILPECAGQSTYERVGVREYITVLLHTKQVIWRELVRGRYRGVTPDDDACTGRTCFPACGSTRPRSGTRDAQYGSPWRRAFARRSTPRL